MPRLPFLFLLLALFSVALPAAAHRTGLSFEKQEGPLLIDIGYPDTQVSGSQALFDFNLWKEGSTTPADFSDVWVRIEKGDATMFAGGINHALFGPTTLLYIPAEEGTYTVSARFEKDGEKLAEGSFPLSVASARQGTGSLPLAAGLFFGGLVFGAFGTFLVTRRRHSA